MICGVLRVVMQVASALAHVEHPFALLSFAHFGWLNKDKL
jgi:hypothetical protein